MQTFPLILLHLGFFFSVHSRHGVVPLQAHSGSQMAFKVPVRMCPRQKLRDKPHPALSQHPVGSPGQGLCWGGDEDITLMAGKHQPGQWMRVLGGWMMSPSCLHHHGPTHRTLGIVSAGGTGQEGTVPTAPAPHRSADCCSSDCGERY